VTFCATAGGTRTAARTAALKTVAGIRMRGF
jgi:hypothetical protein